MFLRDNETTNVPSTPPPQMSECEQFLNDLLTNKQNLLAILAHATSMPRFELLNERLNLDRRMNKIINTTLDHLDAINERIRELKTTMFQKCHRNARNYQINLMGSVLSNGERFGISLDLVKPSTYTDGRISLIDYNVQAYEFPKDQQKLLATASDIFLNPMDIAAIVTSDPKIASIANEVFNYVVANDVNLFLQFSPFAKYVYVQCIKALITCLPAHDMVYFNRYLIHFDSVSSLVNHVYTLTLKAFDGTSMSTADEWSFDPQNPKATVDIHSPISFATEHPLTNEERQSLLYPRNSEVKPTPNSAGSYNVRIMMIDIFTMIARVYKGFPE